MADTEPVQDWATDYDILDASYIQDPLPVWEELRGRCPIAHTDRHEGSFLPTKYADVQAMAKMLPALSSRDPLVMRAPEIIREDARQIKYGANAAPISSDGEEQSWTRRILLPHYTVKAIEAHRRYTVELCNRLIDGFIDHGSADAAGEYAQQIPPRLIALKLGVDEDRAEEFTYWVRAVLELGLSDPDLRVKYRKVIRDFFHETVEDRMANPGGDDLVSHFVAARTPEGDPIDPEIIVGMCNLQLVAGIDTTWSSIGSALWHFATHPEDRRRLAGEPELFPTAVEESLRFYSPVTMAREVIEDVEYNGVHMSPGDKVIMNFPGANHDPEAFEDADKFIIDRKVNRHIAFGAGIHRCAGSNLARMEMDVALRTWFERIPEFEVSDPAQVTWAGGQVRGPRYLPVSF
nr:putative cytochrome P450 [uncultured bacterium]